MRIELRRSYPAVHRGGGLSCGGSQNWFPDENFRNCGCGVIACADVLLYLTGRAELSQEAYLAYVNALRRYFPLIPGRGIDGLRLALGLNLCFRKNAVPVRARWCVSGARFFDRLETMLADDLPAVIAIGPNFPRIWGRETLPLYRKTEEGYVSPESTKAHFLTVLAMDDNWMEVSSWGRRLYLERRAYAGYMRRQGSLFTNLLSLKRI